MKSFILVFIVLFSGFIHAQDIELIDDRYTGAFNETEKLASLCRVWGFLKYYHPRVAKGKFDWDAQLRIMMRKVEAAKSKEELSRLYLQWINSLGKVKPCKKCHSTDFSKYFTFNLDNHWMKNEGLFTDSLMTSLTYILKNRNHKKNHYVRPHLFIGNAKFKHEDPYKDSLFPSSELRLLGLFRYWNAVNYFFPYKYQMTTNWNTTLTDMIPKFKNAEDTIGYTMAIMELTARLDDGHAIFGTKYTYSYFGSHFPVFAYRVFDNKLLVTSFYNDSLAKLDDMRAGDLIVKIGDQTVEEVINEKKKYFAASNEPARMRYMTAYLLMGKTDAIQVTYERDGVNAVKTIHRYTGPVINYKWQPDTLPSFKKISNDIGYVDMDKLKRREVKKAMKTLMSCKGIIFDIRGYPNGTYRKILKYLNKENVKFVKFSTPKMDYPGLYDTTWYYYTGPHSKKYYKGKVVLLVNQFTQSHAEFSTMALKATPNAIIIGSNTCGADGDITPVYFPGNYRTYFSGIGVYFPDGRETQRVGLIPDIECKQTKEGILAKKDEVLERAIQYINTGK